MNLMDLLQFPLLQKHAGKLLVADIRFAEKALVDVVFAASGGMNGQKCLVIAAKKAGHGIKVYNQIGAYNIVYQLFALSGVPQADKEIFEERDGEVSALFVQVLYPFKARRSGIEAWRRMIFSEKG